MRNEYFLQAIGEVKNFGFNVYVLKKDASNKEKLTYCFIEDENGNVGYMQEGDFGGVRFSTVHRPNRITGTGFGLQNWDEAIYNVTKEDVIKSFMFAPDWANMQERQSVKKYKNFAEYQKLDRILEYVKY